MKLLNVDELSVEASHSIGLLTKWLRPNDHFLDIGCDTAEIDYFLEKNGYNNVYSTDIQDYRKFPSSNFVVNDGIHLPFKDSYFDLVALNFVLHHVDNSNKILLLKETIRVSKKSVFILEDTPRNVFDKFLCYIHGWQWVKETGKTGFGFYSKLAWENILTDLGLKIIVSQTLPRLSRAKRNPISRTFFLLEK